MSQAAAGAAAVERPLRGIVLMVGAVFLLASVDATNKVLIQRLPAFEIVWVRFLIFALFALALAARGGGVGAGFRSNCLRLQLARGIVLVTSMVLMVASFRYLPLAEVQAILAATPLIVTALSVPLLGERVGWRSWSAVGVGMAGVLAIIRPGVVPLHWAVILPLAVAATLAGYQIMVKLAARHDGSATTLIYTAIPGAVAMTAIGPFFWIQPTAPEWGLLAVTGLLGAAAHFTLIKALEAAPASLLQPFIYLQMVIGAGYGVVLFGEVPAALAIAGAALVSAAGSYTAWRQMRRPRI